MKKVIVTGCPGAGKSTFARRLHVATGLPLYHLDMLWHKSDRSCHTREEFDAALASIIDLPEWIIDGNYSRTLDIRLRHCDTVFLLDYPAELCIRSVEGRIGIKREDMPWTEEEFEPEFRQYILDFPSVQLPTIYRMLEEYAGDVIIFKCRDEADAYIEERRNRYQR